jgi:FlaA1/EpsC-like NDP-sugar epimerase
MIDRAVPARLAELGDGLAGRVVRAMRRDAPLFVIDVAIVLAAYLAPLVLRFNGSIPHRHWRDFLAFVPIAAMVHLLANWALGLYGQMWRYAGVQEARRVVLAGASAGVVIVGLGTSLRDRPVPLSVLGMGALFSLGGFGMVRFQSRLFGFRRREAVGGLSHHRVLVVGAGEAGVDVVTDILRHPGLGLDPAGFVDDDPRKATMSIRGVRVCGTRRAIPHLVSRLRVDQVILAIPSATSDVVREVAAVCEEMEIPLRVLPSVREIVSGRASVRDVRDLRIEDLLGRRQVVTDLEGVAALLSGRRVLVTGAGGSIGSEIARQVCSFGPSTLVLLDHDETHLHDVGIDLDGQPSVVAALADVRDRGAIARVFRAHRPEIVFHAAAHKHVPVLEAHPEEAFRTNVLGTLHVAHAAMAGHARRFVLISTDKAVRPASVMGGSKWLAEQVVRSLNGNGCVFSSVRFGNVVGSRGSVIPTFLHQILNGGPVTVTDPAMERYFMSVQEAVQLVLQASAMAGGGEVFTLDMGERVNIMDLARRLIRLSGRVPDRDVAIQVVGSRPGEKIVEELTEEDEPLSPTGHPGIMVSRPPAPDVGRLDHLMATSRSLAEAGRREVLADLMRSAAMGGHLVRTAEVSP